MAELPVGTVTFLFTDIEGSTRLLSELGEGYPDVLAAHRRALRAAFAAHGGVEVDTQGDAFFVAFSDARAAAAAAAQGQCALASGPVRVRMGLHTGEPLVWAEGYVGLDVHRGARVCSAAHGGQVVLSDRTAGLLDGVVVRDLGFHRLKDLSEPQRLYQLGEAEFPPLRTLHATNLPSQPAPIVGRERELQEVGALLREHRLVTLIGPGGSGKTRLALQVAADLLEDFPDGTFWVPLQAVRDPEFVLPTVAQTVGARGSLADHLGDRRVLLLLDNFEQVIDAAPELADLLAQSANTRFLVTSREPLRIAGEHRFGVEPLPEHDAATLFLERARAVDPGFQPSPAVNGICLRLEGLPLALELAAARLSLYSADELLERLDRVLPVLTGGARDAPERQRTLRATIEWSHELLTHDERRLFRRLGVFAGSFALDAIEPVCRADLDGFQSLVDKSLARRWASGRFGMLETVHEYAEERLDEAGETEEAAHAHYDHYLAIAASAKLAAFDEGVQRPELARAEQENIRRALGWTLERGEAALGLQLALALDTFWVATSPFEGRRWVEQLLALQADLPPGLRAHALLTLGGLVFIVGEFAHGTDLYEEALAEYRALDDERGIAQVLVRLATAARITPDLARARAYAEEGLALYRSLASARGQATALGTLGTIEWDCGNRELALELTERSAALAGSPEADFPWWQGGMLYHLCEWYLELGRLDHAQRYAREALSVGERTGDRMRAVYLVAILARIEGDQGRHAEAGLLWGALEAEEQRGMVGQWEAERAVYAEPVLAHRGADFERGREHGRTLALHDAVAHVWPTSGQPDPPRPAETGSA